MGTGSDAKERKSEAARIGVVGQYLVVTVLILKLTVWPRLTLISVAKPSIVFEPPPMPISHTDAEVPDN